MDDGDVRPASGLFALKGRVAPVARVRLAWKPWLRGFVLGVVLGALAATVAWLVVLRGIEDSLRPSWTRKVVN